MEMKKYKLGDIAKIDISGVDKKSKPLQKVVRLCNFVDVYHNWAITHDLYYSFMVATASDKEIEVLSLKKGQVAFTKDSETRDDIGIPTYIADDFDDVVLGYHTALVTPNKDILDGKYLNAFMNSKYIHKYFENHASGSGQRYTLSNDTLNRIPVFIPTLEKQQFIGNIFSTIDKKIALNKKMNQKLEAMAKRLYDYWFVQFDFPDKNGRPYKTSGGKMVYNEVLKRDIPAGWEVGKLGDCLRSINTGLNPRDNFKLGNGRIRYITVKNLTKEGSLNFGGCDLIDEEARAIVHYRSDIDVGDILFASIAPLGRCYLIQEEPKDWDINESVFSIRAKEMLGSSYLYFFLRSSSFVKYAENGSTGSIFLGIRINALMNTPVIIPEKKFVDFFTKKIKESLKLTGKLSVESAELTAIRDKLLPLLMNGQVEVE